MTRVFHPYPTWEDWHAGQYALRSPDPEGHRQASVALLSDPQAFAAAARAVLREWAYAAEVNLTNREQNRRAWLGQAACCWHHEAPAVVVCRAWVELTVEQRVAANRTADEVIREWEVDRAETLFGY